MRLIDTKTHLLLEPWKAAGNEYAILSHTWGDQEVIFQEWEQLYPSGAIKGQCPHVRHQGIDKKAGYFKVMQACEQAQRDGIRYLWCDTMCINKESSAELSEAINSMFMWYCNAKVCYVYLTDVTFPSETTRNDVGASHSNVPGWFPYAKERKQHEDLREMNSRFMASRWWTRGWTLQELLAPRNVAFFMQDWTLLGHKSSLAHLISASTRIHRKALEDHTTIGKFSIAQRMSWAADRTTTVVEDMAYCLLGIFDINIPMLYGQGEGAFQKLQHEIIKATDDQSIFAWIADPGNKTAGTGALAKSPQYFRGCGSIIRDPESKQEPYSLTNVGFRMRVPIIQIASTMHAFIGLGCSLELHGESSEERSTYTGRKWMRVWIPVQQHVYTGSYERIHSPGSHVYFQNSYSAYNVVEIVDIYLLESFRSPAPTLQRQIQRTPGIPRTGISISLGFGDMSVASRAYKDIWHPQYIHFMAIGSRGPCCTTHEVISSGSYYIILSVAWDDHSMPHMCLHTTIQNTKIQVVLSLLHQAQQRNWKRSSSTGLESIHEQLRSINSSVDGASPTAPLVIVDDEPLYDMHQTATINVDITFKEKVKPFGPHQTSEGRIFRSTSNV